MSFKRLATATFCVLSVGASLPSAHANFFDTLAGIATDPLKLGKLSDGIQRALIQIDQLEARGDEHAKELLAQLKDIVEFTIQGGQSVEAEAFQKLNMLETKIDEDLINLIYRAECAGETLLNDRLQQAIVTATDNIEKSRPSLTILGIPIVRFHTEKVTITDPYTAYYPSPGKTGS